jgi:hypothetical protein
VTHVVVADLLAVPLEPPALRPIADDQRMYVVAHDLQELSRPD